MRFLVLTFSFLAAYLGGEPTAHAMRCRGRLIDPGDSPSRVRALCGDPTDVSTRVVERERAVHRRGPGGTIVSDSIRVSVEVQEWTYDFGPQRFVRRLIFEDGVLIRISTGSYGTEGRPPPPE